VKQYGTVSLVYRVGQKSGATLVYGLRINARNEMMLTCVKFGSKLINISEVTSCKTEFGGVRVYPVHDSGASSIHDARVATTHD